MTTATRDPSFWRKSHGTAAEGGALVVTETTPGDELAQAANPRPPIGRNANGQPATSADASRLARMPRKTLHSRVPREARAYRRARGVELESQHGRVSRGVGAMLDAEACAWLAGSKAAQRAAETGDREDIGTMSKAFDLARQLAKDAWELASREAKGHANQAGDPIADAQRAFQASLAAGREPDALPEPEEEQAE